jgi:hypothetical protein
MKFPSFKRKPKRIADNSFFSVMERIVDDKIAGAQTEEDGDKIAHQVDRICRQRLALEKAMRKFS